MHHTLHSDTWYCLNCLFSYSISCAAWARDNQIYKTTKINCKNKRIFHWIIIEKRLRSCNSGTSPTALVAHERAIINPQNHKNKLQKTSAFYGKQNTLIIYLIFYLCWCDSLDWLWLWLQLSFSPTHPNNHWRILFSLELTSNSNIYGYFWRNATKNSQ